MSDARKFRPDIEGLRAVAILLVLLYHAQVEWFGGGFIGVDVFFVISGFLITQALLKEANATGGLDLKEFYARRIRRLLPASIVVLSATAFGVWYLLPITMWRAFGGDIASAAAYVVNWRLAGRSVDYLAEDVVASPVQHFWSLAVEEQFYLVWPLLILLGIWIHKRFNWTIRRSSGVVLGVVVAVPSLAWSVWLTSANPARAFFVTTTRLWELAIGALIAIAPPLLEASPRRMIVAIKSLALGLILVMAVTVDTLSPWPGTLALGPTLATALLIWLGGVRTGENHDPITRGLSVYPMQRVGAWSYSLYLWHWPPLAILSASNGGLTTTQALVVTAVAVFPAWISYRAIENPIRFSSSMRNSPRLNFSLGACLSLVGVLAGVAVVLAVGRAASPHDTGEESSSIPNALGAKAIGPNESDAELLASLTETFAIVPTPVLATEDIPLPYQDGCQVPYAEVEPRVCRYGDINAEIHIAAVGDSKILQWAPALIEIADRNGLRLSTITKSACDFSLSTSLRDGEPYTECREWTDRVLDLLAENAPDLVIVSQAFGSNDDESRRVNLIQGMLGAYKRVESAGSELVLMVDNPHPGLRVYECVSENMDSLSQCTFNKSDRIGTGGRQAQLEVVAFGGHDSIDLLDMICPTPTCLPVIGGVLVYRQGSHLTATYVETLTDELEARLLPFLPDNPRAGAGTERFMHLVNSDIRPSGVTDSTASLSALTTGSSASMPVFR